MSSWRVSPPERLLPDRASRVAFYGVVSERVRATSGVAGVAFTAQLPFDGELRQIAAAVEHVTLDPNDLPMFDFRAISPDYFGVLSIPLREGRAFTAGDHARSSPVAIVDAGAAERFWPGQSALGKTDRAAMAERMAHGGGCGGERAQ
jgi:putative ABC transport system permease protein